MYVDREEGSGTSVITWKSEGVLEGIRAFPFFEFREVWSPRGIDWKL